MGFQITQGIILGSSGYILDVNSEGRVLTDTKQASGDIYDVSNEYLDIALSTRATEATLSAFQSENNSNLVDIETAITSLSTDFNNEDFASETTLDAFKTQNNSDLQQTISTITETASANNINLQNIYTRQGDKNQFVRITNGIYDAGVDSSGQLKVITPPAVAPEGTTPVVLGSQQKNVGSGDTYTLDYVIPTGEDLHLQTFSFSGYCMSKNLIAKAELWWQPNGYVSPELVSVIYLQSQSSGNQVLQEDILYTGDGTARCQILVTNKSLNQAEIYFKVLGYY